LAQQLGLSLDLTKPASQEAYGWNSPIAESIIEKGPGLFPRVLQPTTGEMTARGHAPKLLVTEGAKPVSELPTAPQPVPAATTTQAAPVAPPATPAPTAPPQITIDEFMKIQLKTAKVLSAERVPKSEKLLKLQVSLGTEQRQIVAGIGKKYEPESLIGKTIVIVANLKPAKLMGIESQGMVLAAGDSEVRGLATILEEVDPGTKVK
jgi:methionyl-tRNA synthetase